MGLLDQATKVKQHIEKENEKQQKLQDRNRQRAIKEQATLQKQLENATRKSLRKKYKLEQKKIRTVKNSQIRVKMFNKVKSFILKLIVTLGQFILTLLISTISALIFTLFIFYITR